MAHELTHVVQQGSAGTRLQRTPAAGADPLCAGYTFATKKTEIQARIDALKAAADVETRLLLIQDLKWIRRCGSETEIAEIRAALEAGLGAEEAGALWTAAGTAFGGYRGTYPGYYGGARSRLKELGVSEINAFEAFAYDPRTADPTTYQPTAEAKATSEAPEIVGTDLLYFYGHQYAQYGSPGAFANGPQTKFIDLRMLAAHPDIAPRVRRLEVMRWGHAMVRPTPGFLWGPGSNFAETLSAHAMGVEIASFGNPETSAGPLTGLGV